MYKRNIDWLLLTWPQPGTEPATQACALTRKGTSDLSVCRTMHNPLSHTTQGGFINLQCLSHFLGLNLGLLNIRRVNNTKEIESMVLIAIVSR